MSIFSQPINTAGFVFTSADLGPRNVLVSGSPPVITGLIDFEFSGFFSPFEEFVQEWPDEEDGEVDWPSDMWETMLQALERRDVFTPLRIRGTGAHKEIGLLGKLRNYIAPWWLTQRLDSGDGSVLDEEVKEVAEKAESALMDLRRLEEDTTDPRG
jgi:hypothetical protein